jgi:hypothetical protein
VPAPCEVACHQAVVRSHAVILALRPLGLVARFLYGQRQRLTGEVGFRGQTLEGLHGRRDASGLDGVQDGGFDRPIDAETTQRQPGGGAPFNAPPNGK